jgi:cytochrome c-type biogenesis protein CcmH/NrfG
MSAPSPEGEHEDAAARLARAPRRGWTARAGWAAAALAALVYLPSLWGGFLYDDQHVVVDNRHIRDLGQIGTVLRSQSSRPLLNLTWALNYATSGLTPWPYHLVNVALHAANAALLVGLFAWMGARAGRADPAGAALAGACLFAATPMAAETVAYVSSRSTALATLLALASLRSAVLVLEPGEGGSGRRRLGAALGFYVLALASKEEALVVPLLLLLLDYFFVARGDLRRLVGRWRIHAPFLVLPVAALVLRRLSTGAWLPPPALPLERYLPTQAAAFPLYLLRSAVPLDPAFYRGHPASPWPPGAFTAAGALVGLGLLAFAILGRRRFSGAALAILWMAACLLPSSSFVALKEMVVDHRAYLGGAGVAFVAGGWLWRAGRGRLLVAVVAVLAVRAIHYQWVLADPVRAWTDAVARAPRAAEAHFALGEAYAVRGDPRAEPAFLKAIALDPGDARAWTNLGSYYVQSGRIEEAVRAMRGAVRAAPRDSRIRNNLGLILLALGRESEALAELEAAIAGEPPLAQPRIDLAAVLMSRGQHQRARALLAEASGMVVDPADAERLESLQQRLP